MEGTPTVRSQFWSSQPTTGPATEKEYSFSVANSIKLLNADSLLNYLPCISFFQTDKKAKNFSEVPGGRLRK